ncbi:hypothetical protein ACFPN2_00835 [Steroidobacter flavus]|uniref:Uncharacterized protein n=1 Tax=Steroidobacter flavus TaxID=1842136 RepID=A0ABV8SMB7_9GAMM
MSPHQETAVGEVGIDGAQSLSERIHGVRTDLRDLTAIVDIARRAISPDEDWCLHHALERVVDRLGGASMDLELIGLDAHELGVFKGGAQ